jgi:uncharacterized membrane protein YkoI
MRRILGGPGVCLLGVLAFATIVRAQEDKAKKIPLDKVPKAIKKAINTRFPGAKVNSVEKEVENGKVTYDVELKQKGRKFEMDILENGTIIEIEKEVLQKRVPKIIKRVKAKFPKATIKEVMEVNKVKGKKETRDHYEVTIDLDGKKQEVIVSLDGKRIKEEEQKDKK